MTPDKVSEWAKAIIEASGKATPGPYHSSSDPFTPIAELVEWFKAELKKHGEDLQAVWSPENKIVALTGAAKDSAANADYIAVCSPEAARAVAERALLADQLTRTLLGVE